MLAETLPLKSDAPHLRVAELSPSEPIAVLGPVVCAEPLRSAADPVAAIARDAKGRLMMVEYAAGAFHTVGPRITILEVRALSRRVLSGDAKAIADPDARFKLALGLLTLGMIAGNALDGIKPQLSTTGAQEARA